MFQVTARGTGRGATLGRGPVEVRRSGRVVVVVGGGRACRGWGPERKDRPEGVGLEGCAVPGLW